METKALQMFCPNYTQTSEKNCYSLSSSSFFHIVSPLTLDKTNKRSYNHFEVVCMNVKGKDVAMFYDMKVTDKFINEFYTEVNTKVPYTILENDILSLMTIRNVNYFKIPSSKTRSKKDIYFRYEIIERKFAGQKSTFLYKYKGYDFFEGDNHELD